MIYLNNLISFLILLIFNLKIILIFLTTRQIDPHFLI